jgi:TIR domain
MPGIFLSYRRIDTEAWAGRLFERLQRRFGVSQVFMDIKGGIPRGADFERVLTEALTGCEVLLTLIGPQWLTCARTDGTRRLDVPEDWVCNEIVSALRGTSWSCPFCSAALGGPIRLNYQRRCVRCPSIRRQKSGRKTSIMILRNSFRTWNIRHPFGVRASCITLKLARFSLGN